MLMCRNTLFIGMLPVLLNYFIVCHEIKILYRVFNYRSGFYITSIPGILLFQNKQQSLLASYRYHIIYFIFDGKLSQ